MMQVGAALTLKIEHIVEHDGELLPASLLDLAQQNCWRHDGSVAFIFGGVKKLQ